MSAGSPISRRAACASSAIRRKRIAEDYLRILRFFRFHAAYGTSAHPDADGLAACIAGRDGLDQLSRERVRMELMKLVVAPHAVPTLVAMADAGLLLRVIGGVAYLGALEMMAKVAAAIGLAADPVRRLGALAVAVSEDAERLWQKLRLTNASTSGSPPWRKAGGGWRPATSRTRARCSTGWGRRSSPTACCSPGRMRTPGAHDRAWLAMASLPQRWSAPAFPLRAADFIARGVEKGPVAGRRHARGGSGVDQGGLSGGCR